MMKKIYFTGIILGLLLSACGVDDDYIFDENAVVRTRKVLEACAEALLKPAHGWKMVYVPNAKTHGGYNVLMDFKDESTVEIFTDFLEEHSTSTYSFNASQGPVLSFDTYSCLHYLADPKNAPVGKGLLGEFEFVIQKITQDSLVFLGKKYGNRITFLPAEEKDWTERMDAYRLNIERLTPESNAPFFRGLTMNTTAVNLIYDPNTRSLSYTYADDIKKEIITERTAVFGTEEGVAFEPTIKVNGVSLGALRYNEEKKLFESNTQGVLGELTYSHKPPFVFYDAVKNMRSNSNFIALPSMGTLDISSDITSALIRYISSLYVMSEELKDNYLMLVLLGGVRQVRMTWALDYMGEETGPWLTYFGVENILKDDDCDLNYGLDMETVREDQVRFKLNGKVRTNNYVFQENVEKQPGHSAFRNFFTDPAGFTVVPAGNNQYYLVNLADSRRWVLMTKE